MEHLQLVAARKPQVEEVETFLKKYSEAEIKD